MRRMFNLLVTLFTIYYGTRLLVGLISHGHTVNYIVNDYSVKEMYKLNKDDNNYFLEISKDNLYTLKVYKTVLNKQYIVDDIEPFIGDEYSCINVKLNIKDKVDIICNKDNIQYSYSTIKGKDKKLDDLISNTDYNIEDFIGDKYKNNYGFITIYENNLIDKRNIVLLNYRGYYYIHYKFNKNILNHPLYKTDVYTKLGYTYKNYIILADYTRATDFNTFNIINIKNGSNYKIEGKYDISFDLIYQIGIKNDIYVIDKYNKKQYKIDLKNKEITLVGTLKEGVLVYENNEFITKNINEVITSYEKDNIVYPNNGYEIIYKENNNNYDIYTIDNQNKDILNYAFTTTSLQDIQIEGNYIYYTYNNTLYVHTRFKGNKKILESKELIENNNLYYAVYKSGGLK